MAIPKALVLFAEGFEEIEAVTVVDVLRRGGVEVVTASIADSREVAGAHGITMRADAILSDVAGAEFDTLVLPGGGPGTENLRNSQPVIDLLHRQKDAGRLICAICAAPTVLVEADVLDPDQHVTCYPTCSVDLDRSCANVPVVVDRDVITGQAPGSAMLFALVIVKTLMGEKAAQKVARGLVTDVMA